MRLYRQFSRNINKIYLNNEQHKLPFDVAVTLPEFFQLGYKHAIAPLGRLLEYDSNNQVQCLLSDCVDPICSEGNQKGGQLIIQKRSIIYHI